MPRIELWTMRHPNVEKGWIYLTEESARNALQAAKKKLKKTQPRVKIEDFIIEPYHVLDKDLLHSLRETNPELFL